MSVGTIEERLERLERAVYGEPALQVKGILDRMIAIEKQLERLTRIELYLKGALVVLGLLAAIGGGSLFVVIERLNAVLKVVSSLP